ncbi:hypothetical protein PGB90_004455 [Kerria lacca]
MAAAECDMSRYLWGANVAFNYQRAGQISRLCSYLIDDILLKGDKSAIGKFSRLTLNVDNYVLYGCE